MVDLFLVATLAGVVVTGVVGTFTVRSEIKKGRDEQAKRLDSKIETVVTKVATHIDKKITTLDNKFEQVNDRIDVDEEDIGDIEEQMKQLVKDAKETCDKLSKFDYIEKNVIPEFQRTIRDFYRFKARLDAQEALVNSNNENPSTTE